MNLRSILKPVNSFQWEKFKVVVLVKPSTFEVPERQVGSPSKRQGIDCQLNVCMLFFSCFGFVIKDVKVVVADL